MQEEQNQAVGEGVQKADQLGQSNLRAAGGAKQIAREMMTTNTLIQQATGSANQLAGALQGAASAAASVGAGMSSMGGQNHVTIGKYKAVNGKMVEKTEQEIQQEYLSSALSGRGGEKIVYDNSSMSAEMGAQYHYDLKNGYYGNTMYSGRRISAVDLAGGSYQSALGGRMGVNSALAMGNPFHYAKGGYVTGPQQAVVGEGGEPEYIIPESKLSETMDNYRSGKRGKSMIPNAASHSDDTANESEGPITIVNEIEFTGDTIEFNEEEYVKKEDVKRIAKRAAKKASESLRNLMQKSSKFRLEAGLR